MSSKCFLRTISQAKPETTCRKSIYTKEKRPQVSLGLRKLVGGENCPESRDPNYSIIKSRLESLEQTNTLIEILTPLMQLRAFLLKNWS